MNIFPENSLSLMLPGYTYGPDEIWNFRVYTFVLPLLPLVFMGLTFFPSIERGKIASILALLRQLIFYIPVMLIIPMYFGIRGVFFGATVIDVIMTILIVYQVNKELKKIKQKETVIKQDFAEETLQPKQV